MADQQNTKVGPAKDQSTEAHLEEAFKAILKSKFGGTGGLIGTGIVIAAKVNPPFESKKKQWWEVQELTISTGASSFVYKEFKEVSGPNQSLVEVIPQFSAVRVVVEKAESEQGGLTTVMGEIEVV